MLTKKLEFKKLVFRFPTFVLIKIFRKVNLYIKKNYLLHIANLTLKGYELMIKGWHISEGIFNLVPSSKKNNTEHSLLTLDSRKGSYLVQFFENETKLKIPSEIIQLIT